MRSHNCGELGASDVGTQVTLAGWVHRRRDHGGVTFIDLRDRYGLTQIVLNPDESAEAHAIGEKVRSEFVLLVKGTVRPRPSGSENPNLSTGAIEVAATEVEVLADAQTPPFQIEDRLDVAEETRIRYRYLDLRRPEMQRTIILRHKVIAAIRRHFDAEGFIEIETPVLTKATPEGARDFLVPSRLQPGSFFALPQSPQLFKQLLMIAGFDRYYQIARCFRDEDARADRQPDFTQLDMEMSFVDESDIRDQAERMFRSVFMEALGMELPTPFPVLTYEDAISRFGTDKPDLRFGLEMTDVTDVFAGTAIKVFARTLGSGGSAKALLVPGQAGMSRKDLERLTVTARNLRAGGLAWVAFQGSEISSPLAKFMSEEEVSGLKAATGASASDLVLIVCDRRGICEPALGAVRLELADMLGLRPELEMTDPERWKFAWIVDPPLVEWNEDEQRWDAVHHPFTAPKIEHESILESDPGAVRARCYDIVLNGWELATGSIRIHRPELQRRVFDLIGLDEDTVQRRFGWFLKAFDHGAPPHGGIAPGIDRIVALLAGKDSIREVIAFPKTGTYTDPMTGAPDAVDPGQLEQLHIRTLLPES